MTEGYRTALKSILNLCNSFYEVNPETEHLEKLLLYVAKSDPEKLASYINTYFSRALRLDFRGGATQEEINKMRQIGARIMKLFGFETVFNGHFAKFLDKNQEEFYSVESALYQWRSTC